MVLVALMAAAAASGRSLPIHRDYSVPVLFYDSGGHLAEGEGREPDRVALQMMRDTRAQEELMGRETLMEMTFGSAASPLRAGVSPPPVSMNVAGDGDGRRRRPETDNRNWLLQSLALPSLGQTSTNAARLVIASDEEDSGWGWLADEIKQRADLPGQAPVADAPQDAGGGGRAGPYASDASRPRAESPGGAAGPRSGAGPPLADRSAERTESTERTAWRPDATSPAPPSSPWRATAGVADFSQTREMLADVVLDVRLDLTSSRMGAESFAGASLSERETAMRPGTESLAPTMGTPTWQSGLSSRPEGRPGATSMGGVDARPSWSGGWNNPASAGPGLAGASPAPSWQPYVPQVVPTSDPRVSPQATPHLGAKPAWY